MDNLEDLYESNDSSVLRDTSSFSSPILDAEYSSSSSSNLLNSIPDHSLLSSSYSTVVNLGLITLKKKMKL